MKLETSSGAAELNGGRASSASGYPGVSELMRFPNTDESTMGKQPLTGKERIAGTGTAGPGIPRQLRWPLSRGGFGYVVHS
jgi:hypothetical protein